MGLFGDIGGIVGGIIGNGAAGEDEAAAREQYLDQIRELQGLNPADVATLQREGQVGRSSFGNIDAENPLIGQAQSSALRQLMQVGSGGMRTEDVAAQRQAMDASAQQERGNRLAIMQSMAARGMAGGGNELAAQLSNHQASAQRMSQAGTQAASAASQRALQALSASGQLAGQMYGQKAQGAQAQDAVDRFNAQARTGARQTNFANQMTRQGAIGDARSGLSGNYKESAQRTRDLYSGIGRGAGSIADYGVQKFGGGAQSLDV